jgi:transposase
MTDQDFYDNNKETLSTARLPRLRRLDLRQEIHLAALSRLQAQLQNKGKEGGWGLALEEYVQ